MKPQIAINLWLVAMCLALTVCVLLLHREVRHLRECQQTMATVVSQSDSNIHATTGILERHTEAIGEMATNLNRTISGVTDLANGMNQFIRSITGRNEAQESD